MKGLSCTTLKIFLGISYTLWTGAWYTVVWEKFNVKKFLSLVWHDKNWTHEIFLTVNKKVMFTTNKLHTKYPTMIFFQTTVVMDKCLKSNHNIAVYNYHAIFCLYTKTCVGVTKCWYFRRLLKIVHACGRLTTCIRISHARFLQVCA